MQQPVLRLRGGGANLKRREARKRKFEHYQFDACCSKTSEASNDAPLDIKQDAKKWKTKDLKHIEDVAASDGGNTKADKPQRFICFVGNLPFSATTDSITRHFSTLEPQSVRHCTVKETGKSKGFAFIEFAGYDRMKTCLQYHHSSFDDGISPPRKINVELTVGGGGAKSGDRRSKLFTKNEKLNEERKRRAHTKDHQELKLTPVTKANIESESDSVHPSRRRRITEGDLVI